jgi:hypothetical protein
MSYAKHVGLCVISFTFSLGIEILHGMNSVRILGTPLPRKTSLSLSIVVDVTLKPCVKLIIYNLEARESIRKGENGPKAFKMLRTPAIKIPMLQTILSRKCTRQMFAKTEFTIVFV